MAESSGQAGSVGFEFSRHEYETGEAETESYEGDVQDGFFEDDVDVAVVGGSVDVCGPPEVDPIVVKLIGWMLFSRSRRQRRKVGFFYLVVCN